MSDTDKFKEIENNLRSELLDYKKDNINRWMTAIALIFAFFTFLGGYIILDKSKEAKKLAEEAKKLVVDIEEQKTKAMELTNLIKNLKDHTNARLVSDLSESKPSGIIQESEEATEKVINDPDASFLDQAIANARDLYRKGDIEKAQEQWHSIANITSEINKDIADLAWLNVGLLSDSPEEALLAYDQAIAYNSHYVEVYIGRGIANMKLGEFSEAVKDFNKAINLKSDNVLAYFGRGLANQKLQDSAKAIIDYNIALVLLENNPEYASFKPEIEQRLKAIEK